MVQAMATDRRGLCCVAWLLAAGGAAACGPRVRPDQPFPVRFKPFFRIPVLRQQMFPKRLAIFSEVKVAIIAGLEVGVAHVEQIDPRCFRGQWWPLLR